MSSLLVKVVQISNVRSHPNADKLDIAEVLGWQVVVGKGTYKNGDKVVYFPIDTIIPTEVSDKFGVTKYLNKGRIKSTRLRGEMSFGLIIPLDNASWEVGQDVASFYGASKYEPPLPAVTGDCEVPHPNFVTYTDIENIRNFPNVFNDGEEIVATEKIHGTNCRIASIDGVIMAGSHTTRKKRPEDNLLKSHFYWLPMSIPGVEKALTELSKGHNQVIIFGETYGAKVQSLHYGKEKDRGFIAFDIMIDGIYLGWEEFEKTCKLYDIPMVPVLFKGPFSISEVKKVSEGKTTIGGDHIREGVVIRPVVERSNPQIGRVVLKSISEAYLMSKHQEMDLRDV